MLNNLSITNVALINSASIDFQKGLNVLSGETGAGKSVIIESLNFVLGAKADKTLIRTGEEFSSVTAEFDVSNLPSVKEVFEQLELEYDDQLIISRKFTLDGKNSIKVNGQTVNVSMLKKITSGLVDVHGQSEHFHLLKNANQLQLIDDFGGTEIIKIKDVIKNVYKEFKANKQELEALGGEESQRLVRLDILTYQIAEIERVGLTDGEEEELIAIKQKLNNQKRIIDALNSVKSCVSDEGGVSDLLSNLSRILANISEYSSEYADLSNRLENTFAELGDISSTASSLLDEFDYPDYDINQIEDRLNDIKNIKKKYGATYQEIEEFLESAKQERDKLLNFNEFSASLLEKDLKLKNELYKNYVLLHEKRQESAKILCKNVLIELKELGMPKSQFTIDFETISDFESTKFDSANGIDQIEFMFSANAGEPIKPLSNVISGGEMSRFMLAIKAQTAKFTNISTFIFDEIDAGISGNTAKIVGEKLAKISNQRQIIAITHLPQISAMADNNLLIYKEENFDRAITNVKKLSNDEKIIEIARLISGNIDSQSSLTHAKELIELAKQYKLNNLN